MDDATALKNKTGCGRGHGAWYMDMVQEPPGVPRYAVRGRYGTPEAGTCTAVRTIVGPRGQAVPCASGPYSPYVRYGGPGTYVSAQAATVYVVSSCSSRVRVRVAAGGGA
eukprot:scaffold52239_cov57-Phaeocystis_antarctica.AAC.1